ncbi:uncharacterized protein LOC6571338 [Drosophila grimshawi]|uniref:GH17021 n=1 Tax=Drosophila grimshawi TaxID=7222 RepID=B4IZ05_DROGR|nr:uncharacterized protein LOC6571338 [Drosophila grimshawi]EDV90332.1 GH23378 [Drosophila grimshawi]EDV97713.1 GH17021 [Drosophila grimshawi]
MSSSNATLYYTAIDEMFQELLVDTNDEEQLSTVENEEESPLIVTPKRTVRLRKLNLFAKDAEEFVICRRLPMPDAQVELSPRRRQLRKERQANDLWQLRRQRCEMEQRKTVRRLTMRI